MMTDLAPTDGHAGLLDILERSPLNSISVLIIGSGIGGLTAARECWRRGCDVRIFERQPRPVYTGDSFSAGISALRSLHNYPRLQKEVDGLGAKPHIMVYKLDGTLLQGPLGFEDLMSSHVDREMASHVLRLSRPQLYNTMLEHLRRLGMEAEYGREVVDYFENTDAGRAGVILADGSRHEADLVIAADGVNGHSSRLVLGEEAPAKPSGDAIYRVGYSISSASLDATVMEMFGKLEDGRPIFHMYTGNEVSLLLGYYQDRIEWTMSHQDDGRARESWDHHPPVDNAVALLEPYEGFPHQVKTLVASTPPGNLIDWRIMWRDPQPRWVSPGGRVVQLGDAAHTFHPASGNGATQAMEDAVSLATCLSLSSKDNIPWAMRVHNLLRFERVSCLQAFGIANQADRKNTGKLPVFGRWILLHDPESYAVEKYDSVLSHLREGTPFENTNTPPGLVYRPWKIDSLLTARDEGEATVLDGDWS